MMKKVFPDNKMNRLQGKVILIISGLSESGRILAAMLAQQGADVVIVDSHSNPTLSQRIRQAVSANGRRCLVLTPDSLTTPTTSFSQLVMQQIDATFGRLDAFISYSGTDSSASNNLAMYDNGRSLQSLFFFDANGLTKAALKHIFD